MLTGACAWAQPLQLSRPGSPPPGACLSLLERADALEGESKSASGAVGALRALVAEVLRSAEKATPSSPRSVLLGITLAERLPALEAVLPSLEPTAQALFAKDAAALAAAVPTDHDVLALALRDVLSPLAVMPIDRSAWRWTVPGPAADLGTLGPLAAQSPDLASPLATISRRLTFADTAPAYAPLAADTRHRLVDAAGLLLAPPAWLAAADRPVLLAQFVDACRRLADEPQSVEPTQRLRRLALLGRVAQALSTQRGPLAVRAQQAFGRLAAQGPSADPGARGAELGRLEAIVRAAELLPRRDALRDERRVVRQFRPALRTMLDLARLSEGDLLEVLPEAIAAATPEEAVNAPRFIAAVAAHARRLDDLASIVGASDAIMAAQAPPPPPAPANADPAAREEYTLLANRLLAFARAAYDLGQKNDATVRDEFDRALAKVRSLADDTRDFVLMPGEVGLRARGEGDPMAAVLASLDADRAAWLKGWGSADKHPLALGERLRRLRTLLVHIGDADEVAAILAEGTASPGNAWPGWELSRPALGTLSNGLAKAVADALDAHASGESDADARLRAVADRFAPALLAGRISRLAGQSPALPFSAELTAGPAPTVAPMADRLSDLARVCREAHELSARMNAGGAGIESLRASVSRLARECLEEAPVPIIPAEPPAAAPSR
jgi:hypothetical protein